MSTLSTEPDPAPLQPSLLSFYCNFHYEHNGELNLSGLEASRYSGTFHTVLGRPPYMWHPTYLCSLLTALTVAFGSSLLSLHSPAVPALLSAPVPSRPLVSLAGASSASAAYPATGASQATGTGA